MWIEEKYLGNGDSLEGGVSQAYSQFVQAYCWEKTKALSDQLFSIYNK